MDKNSIIRKGSRIAPSGLTRHIMSGLKRTEQRHKRRKLYCGDASYCPRRATFFATTEGVNELNAAGRFYMDTGTIVHEIIQESLEREGILVEAERRVDVEFDGIKISGKIDGVIRDEGELKVLEIKTCGALPGQPKKDHLHQALTYALLTGIDKVIIFYMSRKIATWDGKLEAVEFPYDVTSTELEMVATLLATSIICAANGVVPPIPSHITSERDCGFCPFVKTCWGAEAQRFPRLPSELEVKIARTIEKLLKAYKTLKRDRNIKELMP